MSIPLKFRASPTEIVAGTPYSFKPTVVSGAVTGFEIIGKPAWAAFDPASGLLTGTPGASDVGQTGDITIIAKATAADATIGPFKIMVRSSATSGGTPTPNAPPTISGTPSPTVLVGQAYRFQPTASDANNDTLTFIVTNKPTWAQFSATTGVLSGTPTVADAASYLNVAISVSDGKASASLPAFSIIVVAPLNGAPTISGAPSTSVVANSAYAFQPTAADPEAATLTFSIQNKPVWASFRPPTVG